jgi:predicted DCC family thiol-disulfide oxidoreductase YuxK
VFPEGGGPAGHSGCQNGCVRPMLIFDGDCGFCTTTANWAGRRLPDDVRVVAWQFVELDDLGLTVDDVTTAAWWVDRWGHAHRGAQAAARALVAMGAPWAALGWIGRVPPASWVAAGLYRLVARYRYRLPGGTPACRLDHAR